MPYFVTVVSTGSILLADLVLCAGLTASFNWFALVPYRRSLTLHWTERAKLLYPARVAALTTLWLLPVDIALAQEMFWPDESPPWVLAVLAGALGAVLGRYPFDRETFPWLQPRAWLHQTFANTTLRFGHWGLFLGAMALMPETLDWRTGALALAFLVLYGFYVWGGLLWCWRKLGLLSPAPERLVRIVSDVSARMNVPPPESWLLHSAASAAFALPFSRSLLFSERLLERHPDDEIAAICAHEMGHLSESKAMLAQRLLGHLLLFFPWLFIRPLLESWGIVAIVVLIAFSWAALRWIQAVGKRLEVRADNIAHRTFDGEAFARALERLHQDNLLPATMPQKQVTHPDLYDRLLAAGIQPDYQRPGRPARNAWYAVCLGGVLGALIALQVLDFADKTDDRIAPASPRRSGTNLNIGFSDPQTREL